MHILNEIICGIVLASWVPVISGKSRGLQGGVGSGGLLTVYITAVELQGFYHLLVPTL